MARDSLYPNSVKAGKPNISPLPSGWVQATLDKYLQVENRRAKLKDDQEYDLVTVKRSRGGVVRREHLRGSDISVKSQFYIQEGDFLISKRQIVHGACGIVPKDLSGSIVSNEYCVITGKPNFHLPFIEYLSESLYFQQTCFHSSIGVHIEKMIFKLESWFKWPFNIPPLIEQKKITQILSTWDKAITTTEQLLANSQQQKKSLMQKLLTGKERLLDKSGDKFCGEWQEVNIGSTSKCFSGGTPSRTRDDYYGGSIPWITSGKLNDRYINSVNEHITEEGLKNSSTRLVKKECILIAMYGATAGKVALNKLEGATINQAVLALEPKSDYHNIYLFYLLEAKMIKALNLVQGGQPNLNASIIKSIKVNFPSFEEQQKIAAALTTADHEITVLQQKIDALKQEKRGLMQQLLTGKRRVSIDSIKKKQATNA